jgi:hypothetical protein
MTFDRRWVEHNGHPNRFLEWRQAEKMGQGKEFDALCDRLFKQGHFVILTDVWQFDEVFFFEDASDAEAFYESGYSDWEHFNEGELFLEVSLFRDGCRIDLKSCARTRRNRGFNPAGLKLVYVAPRSPHSQRDHAKLSGCRPDPDSPESERAE